jgi:hypothetical protein
LAAVGRDIPASNANVKAGMALHLFPSSYRCDCGHQSDFCVNTIKEISQMSRKRKQHLADSTNEEHTIEFSDGKAVVVLCPRLGRRRIMGWE